MSGEEHETPAIDEAQQRAERARVKAETRARLVRQGRCPGCGRPGRGKQWGAGYVSCPACRRYQRIVAGEFREREKESAATGGETEGGSAATEGESECAGER